VLRAWRWAAGLLVLAAGAGVLFARSHEGTAPGVGAAAKERSRRFAWPNRGRWTYAVHWDAASSRTLPAGDEMRDVTGGSLFDGDVSLRSLGADAEGITTLVFTLDRVRDYRLELGTMELISDRDRALAVAALAGKEAFARVDARGVVQSIAYHQDTRAPDRELLRHLVDMMRVTLPEDRGADTWRAREPTPNGMAHVRYEDEGNALERLRLAYDGLAGLAGPSEVDQRVASKSSIEIAHGVVRSIDDTEDLEVSGPQGDLASKWTFTAKLSDAGSFDPANVHRDDLDTGSGEDAVTRERERGRDERLSEGWNLGSIEIQLELVGRGKKIDGTFVPRAGAYVRLHPEACPHLVSWFADDRVSDLGKQLTMDVLSNAGSDEAQEAMRQIVSGPARKLAEALRGAIVQRFLFVTKPNTASARFVASEYDRARSAGERDVEFPAAAALGAVIEHMEGEDELVKKIDAQLRDDLAERRSPEESVALLRALGNAKMDDDLDAILPFASDTSAPVREQVARSLQSFDDPHASRALLELAADAVPMVDRAAFRALREQSLDDGDWDTLARRVEEGNTSPYADRTLVDLIERRPDSGARGTRMLRYVLTRTADTEGTREMRERIRDLLAAGDSVVN